MKTVDQEQLNKTKQDLFHILSDLERDLMGVHSVDDNSLGFPDPKYEYTEKIIELFKDKRKNPWIPQK